MARARVEAVRQVFRRFWPYARPDRRTLLLATLCVIASVACEAGSIWLFEVITDDVLTTGRLAGFWAPAGAWLGLAVLGGFASFGGSYLTARAGERFLLRLRTDAFARVQRQAPGFFAARPNGDLIARLSDDVEEVEQLVTSGVVQACSGLVSVVVFAGAAVYQRWDLALVTFAMAPLLWAAARRFARRIGVAARAERERNGEITSVLEENVTHIGLVQAHNRQDRETARMRAAGVAWLRTKLTEARLSALYEPLVQVLETVSVLVVIGVGAWELAAGRITLGGLLAFAAFIGYLFPPLQELGDLAVTASSARAGADRLGEIMDHRPAIVDHPEARDLRFPRGRLTFENVAYGYPGADGLVFSGLSLSVQPGQTVLVTGPSGAGKSTLANLLLRFADPTLGRIALDGVDLRRLRLASLRANVALVPQDAPVAAGTIAENIAYGVPDASRARIEEAARAADLHDFVAARPDGYDTVIGADGRGLSGGQRQRLAIARALIRNAPVLVLDEPTAGLDEDTARRVLGPLRRLMAGRTTILITHEPHLVAAPDVVLRIEAGHARTVPVRDDHGKEAASAVG